MQERRRWWASLARTTPPSTQPTGPPFHQILGNRWGHFCDLFHILKLEMGFESGGTNSTLNCWAARNFGAAPGAASGGHGHPSQGTHSLPSPTSVRMNTHKKCDSAICLDSFDNNINYFNYELMSSSCKQPETLIQAISSSQPVIY